MQITITTHCDGVFRGTYHLEQVIWSGKRPEIIAHFGPIEAQCSPSDAIAAAQWLTENRLDMSRVDVAWPGGEYTARRPL